MQRSPRQTVRTLAPAPFLLALAALLAGVTALPAHGEEASSEVVVAPVTKATAAIGPALPVPDPSVVSEVVRLPPAASLALEPLREQRVGAGVPYRNGFARSAPGKRVEIPAGPVDRAVVDTGEIHRPGQSGSESTGASWLGRFVVEEAHAFRIQLRDVGLPPGARIWVHGAGVRLGPFGGELVGPDGTLWLPPAPGPEVVMEVVLPESLAAPLRFRLGTVMELVATPGEEAGVTTKVWSDCAIDAQCVDTANLATIDILREATARLSFVVGDSSYLCSGGLLIDKDPTTARPYLLTANHCFDTQSAASSLVAYFDYRTDECNGVAPDLGSVPSVTGATLLATDPVSDFTFVELSENPGGTTAYLGWTTDDPPADANMYRVSHPQGTPQKYSASVFTGTDGITCTGLPTTDFHYSAHYEGSTSGGSSGAPVTLNFGGDARVVGQLFGTCHFDPWDECDYSTYNVVDGAFSTTYPHIAYWINDLTGCEDSYEPDGSSGEASTIESDAPQSHSICPTGDRDWVTFTLGEESAVHLETSGGSGDTRLFLYDSGIAQIDVDDDGGDGAFSLIERQCGVEALPAGTYYAEVRESGDDSQIVDYTLLYSRVESCVAACPTDLVLSNDTIIGAHIYRADDTITLGPSLVVDGTSIELIAGRRVVIGDGTTIGGSFSAGTDPAACSF